MMYRMTYSIWFDRARLVLSFDSRQRDFWRWQCEKKKSKASRKHLWSYSFHKRTHKKKNTLHLASLWHESPTSGAWRVNMSEHCQTQTQSQQAVYRIEQKWWKQETNENSASWCPSQLTVSSIESIVLSAVLFTYALHCKRIQDKTKHGKVPQLNWPFHGKAHKERKSLSCFWLGLDARQKSDEISS